MADGNTPKIVRKHDCRGHRFKTVELLSAILNKHRASGMSRCFVAGKTRLYASLGVSSKDKPGAKGVVVL